MKWPLAHLGDVLIQDTLTERISNTSQERFLTIRLYGNGLVQRDIGAGKTPRPFTGYRVRAGQFVYSRIDARNGAFGIVPDELDGAVCSKDFPKFDTRDDRVDIRYLLYLANSPEFYRRIQDLSFGATNRQRVKEGELLALQIPLPPLPEQRRIAAILDHADELRAKRRRSLALLDELTQSIFNTMFGGDSTVVMMSMGEICAGMFRNGLSPSTSGSVAGTVLTLSAVTGSHFDPTAAKTCLFDKLPMTTQQVTSELLLICRGNGNRELVGRAYFPDADYPNLTYPDTIIAARPDPEIVAKPYLETVWNSSVTRSQISSMARTTNGTFKINQGSLSQIRIPVPPLEQQIGFGQITEYVRIHASRCAEHLNSADQLFDALQSRAFRGEL